MNKAQKVLSLLNEGFQDFEKVLGKYATSDDIEVSQTFYGFSRFLSRAPMIYTAKINSLKTKDIEKLFQKVLVTQKILKEDNLL